MIAETRKRTDIHRPSAIRPEDYEFVDLHYIGCKELDLGECVANHEAFLFINAHRERTGGRYSNHAHGGTCHICGAHACYLAVFYHPATNSYIQTGEDCAAKLWHGDPLDFQPMRRAIANAREAKAGKMKAAALLADAGLSRAWELYTADGAPLLDTEPGRIISDIVYRLIQYSEISDKQEAFLRTLLDRIDRADEIEAERAAEKAAAADCPEGRQTVVVEVLKTEYRETSYGETLKGTFKHSTGFLLWGTVPRALEIVEVNGEQRGLQRGDRVEFTATLERSSRDPKFGFYKRPSKARLLAG